MTHTLRLTSRANDIFPILGFVTAMASLALPLNPFLVGFVLAGAVVAAVHHAEVIAHRVGEPFGTLILAPAVSVIQVFGSASCRDSVCQYFFFSLVPFSL